MTEAGATTPNDSGLAQQLVEISTITGGLAHEIRNPLSTLKVNLQLLDEDWRQVEAASGETARDIRDIARRSRNRIGVLVEEADRLDRILGDFLKYVGKRDLKKTPQDLAAPMLDLADFYRPQAQVNRVELRVSIRDVPLRCDIDGHFIKQAVLNLLINGQQAMPDGGLLELNVSAEGEQWARIDVRDHGPGIPKGRQEHIFHAYYSTKRGGTGLGLATARQIVREHGGRIQVYSEPPNGACLTILLPRLKPNA